MQLNSRYRAKSDSHPEIRTEYWLETKRVIRPDVSTEYQLVGSTGNSFERRGDRGLSLQQGARPAGLPSRGSQPLVARSRLVTIFWGDYPEVQARRSLRTVLANLRQILTWVAEPEDFCLTVDRQTLQLTVDGELCQVDVVRFDECIRNAESAASITSAHALLVQAVELYRDEFLTQLAGIDGSEFEEWRVFQQEVRHRQVLQALHRLTAAAIEQADFSTAHTYAQRQLQLEPWQESARRQLMERLVLQGDRGAALAQFAVCRRILAAEPGAEPDAETVALQGQIKSGTLSSSSFAPREGPDASAGVTGGIKIARYLDPLLPQALRR